MIENEFNINDVMNEIIKEENRKTEINNNILKIIKKKVSNGVFNDIKYSIEISENTYDYKITNNPKGVFQIDDEFEILTGCYINQTTNGGYVGDEFAGTVSIEIGKNEYFEYSYWM